MSFNNIIPAWVLAGDNVINLYRKGFIHKEEAIEKMKELGCSESMIARLDKDSD